MAIGLVIERAELLSKTTTLPLTRLFESVREHKGLLPAIIGIIFF
jgi:hypothetical protein